jgi:hypothetical protein
MQYNLYTTSYMNFILYDLAYFRRTGRAATRDPCLPKGLIYNRTYSSEQIGANYIKSGARLNISLQGTGDFDSCRSNIRKLIMNVTCRACGEQSNAVMERSNAQCRVSGRPPFRRCNKAFFCMANIYYAMADWFLGELKNEWFNRCNTRRFVNAGRVTEQRAQWPEKCVHDRGTP